MADSTNAPVAKPALEPSFQHGDWYIFRGHKFHDLDVRSVADMRREGIYRNTKPEHQLKGESLEIFVQQWFIANWDAYACPLEPQDYEFIKKLGSEKESSLMTTRG